MIRVLIVSDQHIIRHAVAVIFAQEEDMDVVSESGGVSYLGGAEDDLMPDVVVLDSEVIRTFGLEAVARRVKTGNALVSVLLTSASQDVREDSDRVGAFVCLPKDMEVDALLESIRSAPVRKTIVSPA